MLDEGIGEIDTENVSITWPFGDGTHCALLKGRCTKCWAGIRLRTDKNQECIEITCQGCGNSLLGRYAFQEEQRMMQEQADHEYRLSGEVRLAYDRLEGGPFVWKIVPPLDREAHNEFEARIKGSERTKAPRGRIGRGRFPLGSPGLLFMQARLLTDGLTAVPGFNEKSIGSFPYMERHEDGTLSVHYQKEELEGGPKHREQNMFKMMGTNMIASMSSAFACELVIKAICLTRNGNALKSHNLHELYLDLPLDSRIRIEFDYSQLPEVMNEGRERFGDWRYFEQSVGEAAISSVAAPALSLSLLKSARVLLDEAETVESPRVCRRLHFLRGLSNEQIQKIFPGNPGTCSTHGV